MDLLSDIVLALRELFNSQIDGFLKFKILIFKPFYFLVQYLHMIIIFFMVLEGPIQLLLLNLQLIQQRGTINEIPPLQFCISMQIFIFFLYLPDLHL